MRRIPNRRGKILQVFVEDMTLFSHKRMICRLSHAFGSKPARKKKEDTPTLKPATFRHQIGVGDISSAAFGGTRAQRRNHGLK